MIKLIDYQNFISESSRVVEVVGSFTKNYPT